jgi:metallo-beta-lactamase family protein
VHSVPFDTPFSVLPGIEGRFHRAGHIPGAASVVLQIGAERRTLVFSGDIGNALSPLQSPPVPAGPAGAVWLESTYGAIMRGEKAKTERAAFRQAVGDTVREGGIAWIPAFALDRTQQVLWELGQAQRLGAIPASVPIFTPSPSANEITRLYKRAFESDPADWFRWPLSLRVPAFPQTVTAGRLPANIPMPSILVTSLRDAR